MVNSEIYIKGETFIMMILYIVVLVSLSNNGITTLSITGKTLVFT